MAQETLDNDLRDTALRLGHLSGNHLLGRSHSRVIALEAELKNLLDAEHDAAIEAAAQAIETKTFDGLPRYVYSDRVRHLKRNK